MITSQSKEDFIVGLEELGGADTLGIEDYISSFPRLFPLDLSSNDPITSLKYSILILWCEVVYSYGYGLSQISIIGCRAIAERTLRVIYHSKTNTHLGSGTLGAIIRECRIANIDGEILRLAEEIKEYGNDRAHGNLERLQPILANLGGKSRVVKPLDPVKHVIYPYRGEAKRAILAVKELLISVYG